MAFRFQLDDATANGDLELGEGAEILANHRAILPKSVLVDFYRDWRGNRGQLGDLMDDWMQAVYDLLRYINGVVSSGSAEDEYPGFTLWW